MRNGLAKQLLLFAGRRPRPEVTSRELGFPERSGRDAFDFRRLIDLGVATPLPDRGVLPPCIGCSCGALERSIFEVDGKGIVNCARDQRTVLPEDRRQYALSWEALARRVARDNGWQAQPQGNLWLLAPAFETPWGKRAIYLCFRPGAEDAEQLARTIQACTGPRIATVLVPALPDQDLVRALGYKDIGLVVAGDCLIENQSAGRFGLDKRQLAPFLEADPNPLPQPLSAALRHWGDREDLRVFYETLPCAGSDWIWVPGHDTDEARAAARHRRAREKLESQIIQSLRQGDLVAEAFSSEQRSNDPRMPIHQDRWAVLQANFEDATANDGNVRFSGILVSCPDSKPHAPPPGMARLTVHRGSHRIQFEGIEIRLSARETAILATLAEAAIEGRPRVDTAELRAAHFVPQSDDKAVAQAVSRIRRRMRDAGVPSATVGKLVLNLPTAGYRLALPAGQVRLAES